ncbi:MAG: HAD family hydrolase, partial [Acidimicrobiales bacterium]
YDEALDLMAMHRDAGRKVFIVSASPEEIVAPLAQFLGADEAIATQAVLDEHGCYTGEVERYCYGPEKVAVLEQLAERDGIDLSASYAYSDSATDAPMLSAVGHPVAVNPDRELLRMARDKGWEIVYFSHRVPLRERVAIPSATTVGVSTVVAGAAAGGTALGWWLWQERRRRAPTLLRRPAPTIGPWPGRLRWRGAVWPSAVSGRRRPWSSEALVDRLGSPMAALRRAGPSWLRAERGR